MSNSFDAYYDAFKTVFKDEDGDEATFDEEHSLDIDLLIDQFSHIQLQISFEFYLKHQNKLIKNFRSLYINSILKNKNLTTNNKENYSLINEILKDFQYENNYKFVIGINSMNSFEKLTNYSFNFY